MMDLKEIIKWFIPCFHILQVILKSKELRLTFIFLFLLFNFRTGCAVNVNSDLEIVRNQTKYVDSLVYDNLEVNQSDVRTIEKQSKVFNFPVSSDGSVGRTFGRPFKKMIAGLLPVVFQIGAASTWAVVAALVGVKTLIVTLVILKILLIAGAAKVGALFASKGHGHHSAGWEAPHGQKEIHLHIHNGHPTGQEEHGPLYGAWNREDAANVVDLKNNPVDPYSMVGPPTIKTPFGNYVKLDDPVTNLKIKRK